MIVRDSMKASRKAVELANTSRQLKESLVTYVDLSTG